MRLISPLLSLVLFLIVTRASAAPAPITLLTEEWPPFNYSEDGVVKGFSVEIVQAVMRDLKENHPITILPGQRAMLVLNGGGRTMFFSMIRTAERESLYKWIGPFGEQSIYFFKRKGEGLSIKTLDDAKRVDKVCSRSVGLVFNLLMAAGFTNLDTGTSPEGIYLKAVNGRCDLAIGESALGVAYWLNKSGVAPDALEKTAVKIAESPFYIAASKDLADAEIARWQQALDKVVRSGEYDRVYRRYLQ